MIVATYVWNHKTARVRRENAASPAWIPVKPWEKACFGVGYYGEVYVWLRGHL